jgi:hypothetical protein
VENRIKFQIIYVSRNPKDVAISMYHHILNIIQTKIDLERFLDKFLENDVFLCPLIEHNLMCWELEKQGYPNILFISYEEMKLDLDGNIEKVQWFLGKRYGKEKIELLKEHLSFENMKSE